MLTPEAFSRIDEGTRFVDDMPSLRREGAMAQRVARRKLKLLRRWFRCQRTRPPGEGSVGVGVRRERRCTSPMKR